MESGNELTRHSRRRDDAELITLIVALSGKVGAIDEYIKEGREGHVRLQAHIDKEEAEFREFKSDISEVKRRMEEIPDQIHRKHHELIDKQIQREQDQHDLRKSIIEKLATGGVWAVVVGFGALIMYAAKHYINDIAVKGP
mgnify:CR=1 FL=1